MISGGGRHATLCSNPREEIVADLGERADGRVPEGGIGLCDHRRQRRPLDIAIGQRPDDPLGDVGIAAAGKAGDLTGRQRRPGLGHIKPAIAGEPGQQRIGEGEGGSLPAGGHMQHGVWSRCSGVMSALGQL